MRLDRQGAIAIVGALAFLLALPPLDTLAQGDFFDTLFGPEQPSWAPPGRSRRIMRPPRQRARAPKATIPYGMIPYAKPVATGGAGGDADSMSGGAYCVRVCDGYYFPLIKSSQLSAQQSCDFACPSARVQLYQGASIDQARNAKGERYSALRAAFSFRDKFTARCSCNDPAASRDYYLRLSRRDPTLRSGDIVVGEKGAFIYNRSSLVSISRAPRHVRARLRSLLPRNIAPGDASAARDSSIALNRTQRLSK
jgi:hypothetical protein